MSLQNAHKPFLKIVKGFANTQIVKPSLTAILDSSLRNRSIIVSDDFKFKTGGKARKIMVSYFPPDCKEDDVDCSTNLCNTNGVTKEPVQIDFELKKCTTHTPISIPKKHVEALDEYSTNDFYLEMLGQEMYRLREKLTKQILNILIANTGRHLDGSQVKNVNLINPTTTAINPIGAANIAKTFQDANLSTNFIGIGTDVVYNAQFLSAIGGLNQNGQNTGLTPLNNYVYESFLRNIFQDNKEHILAFDPSVFKFISYSKNLGDFATNPTNGFNPNVGWTVNGDHLRGTIADFLTGIIWDINGEFKTCGDAGDRWEIQLSLQWDLFFLPNNVCLPMGTNGIFHFESCSIVPVECPSAPAPTPVPKNTYEWEIPTDCYPKFINKVILGGSQYSPNVNVANENEFLAMINGLGGVQFTINNGKLTYQGYSALNGSINDTIAIEFSVI